MFRLAIASLMAQKLRLILTSFAIVIGVAFVSGSFVLTDTITARFDALIEDISAGTDVYVRSVPPEFGNEFGQVFLSMPEETLDDVKAVDGVAIAEGSVDGLAQVMGKDGEPVGGLGPPTIATTWLVNADLSPVRIAEGNGRPPQSSGEVVMDVGTADLESFAIGDTVEIGFNGPLEAFTLVGLASFGDEDNLAGATLVLFEFTEAQRVLGLEGRVSSINVASEPEVTPDDLAGRIQPVLPADAEAITVEDANAEQSEQIGEALSFLTIGLLAFAAIAVFVGAFIISNTFRIIVAQRARELALLRAIGSTSRQITRMVVIEAAVIALVSSIIGVGVGILLAIGLQVIMRAAGFGLPDGPLTILPRTIIVGILVGVIVTLVSSILPARKASQVPPVAAMTAQSTAPTRRSLRTRAIWGIVVTAAGVIALGVGLFIDVSNAIWFVALGALTVFIGISILAPLFARPLTSIIGWPIPKLFGVPGELAVQNTQRQPRRTASTASALMIGVALVVFVAIFGSSIKTSVAATLGDFFPADLSISSTDFATGVPPQYVEGVGLAPEIAAVTPVASSQARIDGEVRNTSAIDPATIGNLIIINPSQGGIEAMAEQDGLLVSVAEPDYELVVGTTVEVEMPNGATAPALVVGTFDMDNVGSYVMTLERFATGFESVSYMFVAAESAEGVSTADAQAAAISIAEPYPTVQVQTASELLSDAEAQIDQLLAVFTVLLALALIVAVLGITNTLALSIIERTHEIGLLRAVGMTRRQVRRTIRWESVIIAVFGAVLGILVGILLGWAVVQALADEGLGSFSIPFVQLLFYILIAAIAGVIAAIYPARKAAKLNILEAIAYE